MPVFTLAGPEGKQHGQPAREAQPLQGRSERRRRPGRRGRPPPGRPPGHLTLLLLWNSAARQVNSNERNTIK